MSSKTGKVQTEDRLLVALDLYITGRVLKVIAMDGAVSKSDIKSSAFQINVFYKCIVKATSQETEILRSSRVLSFKTTQWSHYVALKKGPC